MSGALLLREISKRYGAVNAVLRVSLAAEANEIHAVVGENGAGKSTLLKIAAGIVVPDEGTVSISGVELSPATAAAAIGRGVAMVQQHFALVDVFTVAENVMLGTEPTRGLGRLDHGALRDRLGKIFGDLGMNLPLDARVRTLGLGDRQRLEIARALYREARVLILDEPTAVLTPTEATALYALLRRIADAGTAVVVVTHKLDEVIAHADRVSVMRKGALVSSRAVTRATADENALTRDVMGDAEIPALEAVQQPLGDVLLSVKNLSAPPALSAVTFDVRRHEIVGIAGVEGNGQHELVHALAGLLPEGRGAIQFFGSGVSVVHEDRHKEGLVLDASVSDNLLLGEFGAFAKAGWLDRRAMNVAVGDRIRANNIVPPEPSLFARQLSGGNQQKIVIARALAAIDRGADVLVCSQPTRGVDIGAARAIHAAIVRAATKNAAVVLVSTDLAELRALSTRILVLSRGKIAGEFGSDVSDETIGACMLGRARPS